MNDDDKYTMDGPIKFAGGKLIPGDTYIVHSDGDLIHLVGPYCNWPKKEPRKFVVTVKECIERKINNDMVDEDVKFYQKLNRKKR